MKNKKLYVLTFVLFLAIVNRFFEYKPLQDFSNYLGLAVFFVLLIFTFKQLSHKKFFFSGSIRFIVASLFLAVIPAVVIWDQDLFRSITVISPYSYFLLYFFLIHARIPKNHIVTTILVFAYITLFLYIYQFYNPENVVFGYKEEVIMDRGILRVGFPAEGFLFFALAYYLNKLGRKFNLKHFLFLMPFLWMLLAQVTRIYILGIGLIAIYHFMLKAKVAYRILGLIVFLSSYLFFISSENVIIKGIRESAKTDIEQKEDYIRLLEADYFLNQFSDNTATYFFGNGAIDFKSNYGRKILKAGDENNFYLEDVGIVKGYFLFGVLFVVGNLLIFIKSFTIKLPYDHLYLKYYIWMMLVFSFTTRAPADAGFGAVFIVVLYLCDLQYVQENKQVNFKKQVVYKRIN